ncbi:MAG TPA: serine/threonine-protein kinase [Polyangiaceae bacterium]|nr:serine/threonine-protein kinase [Polyangiaceae bacterium]
MSHLDVSKLPPGLILMDKYRVGETLGIGGMGVVIACDHLTLDSKVAIKFLLPQLTSHDHIVRRFMNEAKAAIKIQSEHIARVVDVGRMRGEGLPDDGLPFMVMEYLDGRDLGQHVRSGRRFGLWETIEFVVQAAEALAQAHKVGIIHRDIKPANLFLMERDDRYIVKILDFGISKILDEEPQEMGLTKTSTVLGSGLYMSPEQMRSAKTVDRRTDIYSLGVCSYELLTGSQPHTAETFSELCVKVNIDPPTPLRKHRPDLPEAFARVLERAYARDPNDRFQTVQEFVGALVPFASETSMPTIRAVQRVSSYGGERQSFAPTSLAGSSRPPALSQTAGGTVTADHEPTPRARPLGMAITVGIAALVLAAGVGIFFFQTRNSDEATPAASEAPTAAAATTPSAEPEESATARPEVTGVPVSSATASASATTRHFGRPAPKASASAKVTLCNRLNPETGMMELVPCH